MNPVLILTHNCLELTKRCVASVQGQDISTRLLVIDNASTDGTVEWLQSQQIETVCNATNEGVSKGWNWGFDTLFGATGCEWVLCPNNDTILPSYFYSALLSYGHSFLTGTSVDQMSQIATCPPACNVVPAPDFSAFLIRRSCWETVGPFDERMKLYASDCDYHVRAHRAGVGLWKANVPFFHHRSSTMKCASPVERRQIERQADADRAAFQRIYGCEPGQPGYAELFG